MQAKGSEPNDYHGPLDWQILNSADFNTIYLSGLPRFITAWELGELCRPYGEVVAAWVECDPDNGIPWQFGFVEFRRADSAARAASALHGSRFRGDVLAARQIAHGADEQTRGDCAIRRFEAR